MFKRKGKIKTIKVLRTQKKGVPLVNPPQGEHMSGLSWQVEFSPVNKYIVFIFLFSLLHVLSP